MARRATRRGRLFSAVLSGLFPRRILRRRVLGPIYGASAVAVLVGVVAFGLGFLVFTLPNLSYIDSPSEQQRVVQVSTEGSCSEGRSTGTEYVIELTPLPGGSGTGGTFRDCDGNVPARTGGTVTVFVRRDGAQRLRSDVDTYGDLLRDELYLVVPIESFGVVAAVVNVVRGRRRRG